MTLTMLQIWETYHRCLQRSAMQSWMLNPSCVPHHGQGCLSSFNFYLKFLFSLLIVLWVHTANTSVNMCRKPVSILIHLFRCNRTDLTQILEKKSSIAIDCARSMSALITLLEEHKETIWDKTIVILTKSISFRSFMLGGNVYLYDSKIYLHPIWPRCADSVIIVFLPQWYWNSLFRLVK